ncbi:amidase [Virgibacillus siamensis]|uniref:amidase n=1 Tax=Virgibacillus siamensis TaxID=480071 RepID=UPI00098569C0|nr:amidase [Virgibacillus siamensis]
MDSRTYLSMDATQMAEQIRKRQITMSELVHAAVKQLEKVNPLLNAVVHDRIENAKNEADFIDDSMAFSGVPFLLKNISQAVKDEPLTSGSKLMQNVISGHDSHLVKKLRNAGFLFLGHTNTPEFALKNITEPVVHGPTRNPWNAAFSPGGSSGGAAAAVASGIVPMAGASDGGGSIRIPASFSGLFGLKPTRGRTPVGPGAGRAWQGAAIDFALSRTVRDSAAMLDILQVIQPAAAFQTPLFPGTYAEYMKQPFDKPLRIAYTTASPVCTPVSQDAKMAVEKLINWLESEGHFVEEQEPGVDGTKLMSDYYLMNSGEMSNVVQQLEGSLGRKLTENDLEIESWMLNEAGKTVSAAEFSASLASWDTAAEKMAVFHETYDFYITPSTAYTAPEVGELTYSMEEQERLRGKMLEADSSEQQQLIYDMFLPSLTYTPYTQLANLTGQPAMSLPIYVSDKNMPLGVQVMASKGEEYRLLQLAWQAEQSGIWQGMQGNPYFEV